jgi:hypothetical protein
MPCERCATSAGEVSASSGRWGAASGSDERAARSVSRTWAEIAVVCGVLAVAAYALIVAAPLSTGPAVVVCVFGPSLASASAGLYEVLRLHRATASLKIGAAANVAAAVVVTGTLLAQLGFKRWLELKFSSAATVGPSSHSYQAANGLQFGLDVAWDLFLSLGTFLLALNMWRHPRFGRVFALAGALIAALLLATNLGSFPEPPGDSGLVDLGPLVGLWYLAVAIRIGG